MTKVWFVMLAALIVLLAIGPHPHFNPALPIIGIVVVGFIMLIRLISSPLTTRGGDYVGPIGADFVPSGSFDTGGFSGPCDGGSADGGDCGCSC